ncbi:hypothetical protein Q73A0000_15035 [Kaistella flava (ex Peng et al. 2021)]|uniref:Spore protein YkvP/CgeB glycosyl transferase-like domain-containing protein n=1 Tax=Kaistella flava (ex Peng et al. 2021) TaxID=2038776 RepID=A0A7M2YEC5_9FLAO|nr:hypothetical protein Q73A0000_15035 [Kaistella flava (ex Peng et al. 2021)]
MISFDFWNYDAHIVEELRRKGMDAHHINIGAYQHESFPARVKNTISKILLKRNLKNELRQEMILKKLNKLGPQDQILVINPELIDREFHFQIKKFTKRYIAYLYDSLARCPAGHLVDMFDEVFSFDKKDAEKNNFKLITNYNYLPEVNEFKPAKYDLIYLGSFDKRIGTLSKITTKIEELNLSYNCVVVGKKTWTKKLVQSTSEITFTRKRIKHRDIPSYYSEGKVLLDLMRDNQTGLSFRFFEAMALKKKVITNNPTITDYDFYRPENILVLKDDLSNLDKSFFEGTYKELPTEVHEKYRMENWVETVFKLK